MQNILDILNLTQWPDLESGPNGHIACHRPDVAPRAYAIKIGAPMPKALRTQLAGYSEGANQEFVDELYALCNGMFLGFRSFVIYGIPTAFVAGGPKNGTTVPWDLTKPNIYSIPVGWAKDALIVGVSVEAEDDNKKNYYHSIEAGQFIRVTLEDDYSNIVRRYDNVVDWIKTEAEIALAPFVMR